MRSKISLPSSDIPVELTDSEYSYVEYVCKSTWRNSDEFFRHLIRSFRTDGIPSYEEWIKLQSAAQGEETTADTPFAVVTTPIAPHGVEPAPTVDQSAQTDNGATRPIASEPAEVAAIAPEPAIKPAATTSRPLRDPSKPRTRSTSTSKKTATKTATKTAAKTAQPAAEVQPQRQGRPAKGSTKARALTEKARKGAKSKQAEGTNA